MQSVKFIFGSSIIILLTFSLPKTRGFLNEICSLDQEPNCNDRQTIQNIYHRLDKHLNSNAIAANFNHHRTLEVRNRDVRNLDVRKERLLQIRTVRSRDISDGLPGTRFANRNRYNSRLSQLSIIDRRRTSEPDQILSRRVQISHNRDINNNRERSERLLKSRIQDVARNMERQTAGRSSEERLLNKRENRNLERMSDARDGSLEQRERVDARRQIRTLEDRRLNNRYSGTASQARERSIEQNRESREIQNSRQTPERSIENRQINGRAIQTERMDRRDNSRQIRERSLNEVRLLNSVRERSVERSNNRISRISERIDARENTRQSHERSSNEKRLVNSRLIRERSAEQRTNERDSRVIKQIDARENTRQTSERSSNDRRLVNSHLIRERSAEQRTNERDSRMTEQIDARENTRQIRERSSNERRLVNSRLIRERSAEQRTNERDSRLAESIDARENTRRSRERSSEERRLTRDHLVDTRTRSRQFRERSTERRTVDRELTRRVSDGISRERFPSQIRERETQNLRNIEGIRITDNSRLSRTVRSANVERRNIRLSRVHLFNRQRNIIASERRNSPNNIQTLEHRFVNFINSRVPIREVRSIQPDNARFAERGLDNRDARISVRSVFRETEGRHIFERRDQNRLRERSAAIQERRLSDRRSERSTQETLLERSSLAEQRRVFERTLGDRRITDRRSRITMNRETRDRRTSERSERSASLEDRRISERILENMNQKSQERRISENRNRLFDQTVTTANRRISERRVKNNERSVRSTTDRDVQSRRATDSNNENRLGERSVSRENREIRLGDRLVSIRDSRSSERRTQDRTDNRESRERQTLERVDQRLMDTRFSGSRFENRRHFRDARLLDKNPEERYTRNTMERSRFIRMSSIRRTTPSENLSFRERNSRQNVDASRRTINIRERNLPTERDSKNRNSRTVRDERHSRIASRVDSRPTESSFSERRLTDNKISSRRQTLMDSREERLNTDSRLSEERESRRVVQLDRDSRTAERRSDNRLMLANRNSRTSENRISERVTSEVRNVRNFDDIQLMKLKDNLQNYKRESRSSHSRIERMADKRDNREFARILQVSNMERRFAAKNEMYRNHGMTLYSTVAYSTGKTQELEVENKNMLLLRAIQIILGSLLFLQIIKNRSSDLKMNRLFKIPVVSELFKEKVQ